jgi:hypothetical protein
VTTASTDGPVGREEGFSRLRVGLTSVADLAERLDSAEDDKERRSVLLFLITAAWQAHELAHDAYTTLDREREEDGLSRGVLE